MKIIIDLSKEDISSLQKETKGIGGWQTLLESLKSKIKNKKIILDLEDAVKIIRYSKGQGGFQNRLGSLLTEILKLEEAVLNENSKTQVKKKAGK